MTHEELLAKISVNAHYPECDVCSCGEKFEGFEHHLNLISSKKDKALLAVVELHKPKIYEGRTKNFFICTGCYEDELYLYPCPTIQAIEKELK